MRHAPVRVKVNPGARCAVSGSEIPSSLTISLLFARFALRFAEARQEIQ